MLFSRGVAVCLHHTEIGTMDASHYELGFPCLESIRFLLNVDSSLSLVISTTDGCWPLCLAYILLYLPHYSPNDELTNALA